MMRRTAIAVLVLWFLAGCRTISLQKAGDVDTLHIGRVDLEMVWMPPGDFMMGSPASEAGRHEDEIQHRVKLTKGFWMGKCEVTQELWEKVMGSTPSTAHTGAHFPVQMVSWNNCQKFIGKLNSMMPQGGFRLPTEAEWEYACRAGTTTRFCSGDNGSSLDSVAWYSGTATNTYPLTHPVGEKNANAWGLHDMHGNVWEWCQDWYGDYPSGVVTDPSGPSSGTKRVARGGAWGRAPELCRSASRVVKAEPDYSSGLIGFRLVRAP
jgi:formylglycine-generating enzyme required for sulfatase activity